MRINMRLVLAIFCVSTLGAGPVVLDQPSVWGWFRASSTGSKWWLTHGQATVAITGSRFRAELRDHQATDFIRVSLSGTMRDGNVEVRAIVHASDTPDFELSGRVRRLCWAAGGGREIIVLTNGVDVISLARELEKGQPCEPL